MVLDSLLLKVVVTCSILLVGFFLMRFFTRIIIKVRRMTVKEASIKERPFTSIFEKVFFAAVIITAMFFLGADPRDGFLDKFFGLLPDILLLVLVALLGILAVQLVTWLLEKVLVYTKLQEAAADEIGRNIVPIVLFAAKVLLYVLLADIIVNLIDIPGIESMANYVLYPLTALVFVVFLVVLINPARDFAAGFYLRNLWRFREGNRITYEGNKYTIKEISWLSTELETANGDYLMLPNKLVANRGIEFEKPTRELQTLEDIKNQFVAQLPSLCGPASAQIALSIFKIQSDQQELAKLMGSVVRTNEKQVAGTHPKDIIRAVEKYTHNKVLGAWIGFEKIFQFKQEVHTWLSDGALLIVDYKKKYLFPTALRAHYSLVVGIRGDELLIIDPSGKKGGVYFTDYRDVQVGMDTYSELIGGKRGYIVLAPMGTPAYQRLKDKLIYHHPSMYDKLSKALETRLFRITSTPHIVEMLPQFLKARIKNHEKEQITRVWKP
ncbi:MAG: C39 family peptidase [Candidatus Woesearchaeota archaeon]